MCCRQLRRHNRHRSTLVLAPARASHCALAIRQRLSSHMPPRAARPICVAALRLPQQRADNPKNSHGCTHPCQPLRPSRIYTPNHEAPLRGVPTPQTSARPRLSTYSAVLSCARVRTIRAADSVALHEPHTKHLAPAPRSHLVAFALSHGVRTHAAAHAPTRACA